MRADEHDPSIRGDATHLGSNGVIIRSRRLWHTVQLVPALCRVPSRTDLACMLDRICLIWRRSRALGPDASLCESRAHSHWHRPRRVGGQAAA